MRAVVIKLFDLGPEPVRNVLILVCGIPVLHPAREHRQRSARMRSDQFETGISKQHAVCDETRHCTRGFEIDFIHKRGGAVIEIVATGGDPRMHVHDRLTASKLLPYRCKLRIAGPMTLVVVGINADSVALQRFVRVLDFLQRAIDIRERDRRK